MSINCKGKLIDLSSPKIMGILNITPDSFYDGNTLKSDKDILSRTERMLSEGATFIDVGGYSSRPNAKNINEKEELGRIVPVIKLLSENFPKSLISIDTFRSKVALEAVQNGACMVNDISAGSIDKKMFNTIAELQVPYVIMHMKGTPQNMQNNPTYQDIIKEILFYFSEKISQLRQLQVNDIIIDVGFGFGKTSTQNYHLLNNLTLFKNLDLPILSGLSRKSMLYNLLNINPKKALNATTVAHTIALMNGSNILRVHDVKEANEAIQIVQALKL